MKAIYSLAALALVSFCSEASAATPIEVCKRIAQYNSGNGALCSEIISSNTFQADVLDVCLTAASSNTSNAIQCMREAANNYFEADAVTTCETVARYNTSNVPACLKASANKQYLNGAAQVCADIARSNTSNAVACLSRSGLPYHRIQCPHYADIKLAVDRAIDQLYNGRPRLAVRELDLLSQALGACTR